jgi:hypothetical protein
MPDYTKQPPPKLQVTMVQDRIPWEEHRGGMKEMASLPPLDNSQTTFGYGEKRLLS